MSVNNVIITGNLGGDPTIKTSQNGNKCAILNVAVSERYKDKQGQQQEKVDWIRVETWVEQTVKFCETYMKKGDSVAVQGRLRMKKWEKDGQPQSALVVSVEYGNRIEFNGNKRSAQTDQPQQSQQPQLQSASDNQLAAVSNGADINFSDDIPF